MINQNKCHDSIRMNFVSQCLHDIWLSSVVSNEAYLFIQNIGKGFKMVHQITIAYPVILVDFSSLPHLFYRIIVKMHGIKFLYFFFNKRNKLPSLSFVGRKLFDWPFHLSLLLLKLFCLLQCCYYCFTLCIDVISFTEHWIVM